RRNGIWPPATPRLAVLRGFEKAKEHVGRARLGTKFVPCIARHSVLRCPAFVSPRCFARTGRVSLLWSDRLIGPRAGMLALAAFLLTVRLVPAQMPEHASLTGQLLVASPTMGDPRFSRTVILMVEHNHDGAFGIIINLPVEERPLASLLESLGEKNATVTGSVRIFAGGPVQPEIGFVVHSTDYRRPGTIDINGSLAVTSSREILIDISNNKGPTKSL